MLAGCFAGAVCLLHLLLSGRYGYFRDELYYAACGRHLAWGYVDHAPLIAVIAWLSNRLFGASLLSLRIFPALSSAAKILLTAWMVRELGGKRYAQTLAATLIFFCPIYLVMDNFLSMNSFEPLFWMGAAAVTMRIASPAFKASPRLWLLFGVIAGIGILNKHSMLLFAGALILGLLASSGFRYFRNPWICLGALIAFVFFAPNLAWEIRNHLPTLEMLRNARIAKNAYVPWYEFIAQQALLILPLAAPVFLAGLWFFFATPQGKPYRFLGWTYVFLLLEMLALKARIYYLAPVYPVFFAAGAVWIESKIAEREWAWAKAAVLAPVVFAGLVSAPLALPILPVDSAAAYADFWHVNAVRVENFRLGKLPQNFADMFGWRNQAAVVASVYNALPAEDRERATILTGNYGEAGAIDYFGPALGLPPAISGHNNYYLWGPRGYSGDVVIAVGMRLDLLHSLFGDVRQAATIENANAMPAEGDDLPVYLCRLPRMSLTEAWPLLKNYY
jgi:4-amino-4-deoxy-L-arabinose transferase-like glycosyltransferase